MKRKALVFLIGVVVALAALEGGLRLVGFVYRVTEGPGRPAPVLRDRNTKVILCLGNSYTKGAGASAGMSYPEQLQRMFEEQMPEVRVEVINQGKSSQNTEELLVELPWNLGKILPDAVVLQTGQPNAWNYIGYENYLRREGGPSGWRDGKERLCRIFYQSRVYRLAALVVERLRGSNFSKKEPSPPEKDYFSDKDYQEANQYIMSLNSPYRKSKREPLDGERSLRFHRTLLRAILKDPREPINYVLLGNMFYLQNKPEEAFFWYGKSLEAEPALRRGDALHPGYQALREMRKKDKGADNDRLNKRIDDFISQCRKKRPGEARSFFLLQEGEIFRWMASDMEEIIRSILDRKIRLIIQSYPVTTPANEAMREAAERHSIPFVDNKKVFEEEMSRGVRWEDLFVPDGHCNDRGYHLMAGNVYRKIVDEKLLG